jgi:hypothetical protein
MNPLTNNYRLYSEYCGSRQCYQVGDPIPHSRRSNAKVANGAQQHIAPSFPPML